VCRPSVQDAYDACNSAADALSSYGHTVKSAQDQAKQAIDLYAKGQQATTDAQAAYQKQVEDYSAAAQVYNTAVSAGQNPGTPLTQHECRCVRHEQ
jgi:flagellar hook-basal body complex protein FliE